MVWRLPQLGQGIGWEYTVACHSMSMAWNVWPQSSHLNVIIPLSIPDFFAAIILKIIIRIKFIIVHLTRINQKEFYLICFSCSVLQRLLDEATRNSFLLTLTPGTDNATGIPLSHFPISITFPCKHTFMECFIVACRKSKNTK